MHAQLCAGYHQGISHVISGITHIYELNAGNFSKMLFYCKKIRYHLCGMGFVRKPVPYRHARILCKILNYLLSVAAILDTVIHPSQNPGGIGDALLLSYLGAVRIKICTVHTKVRRRNLEAAAGPCTCLFKYQGDVLSAEYIVRNALFLFLLKLCGKIHKGEDLVGG